MRTRDDTVRGVQGLTALTAAVAIWLTHPDG
jgi:hypothetical protein